MSTSVNSMTEKVAARPNRVCGFPGLSGRRSGLAVFQCSQVQNASRNCCHLAASKLDFTMLEFNDQPAFDSQEMSGPNSDESANDIAGSSH